MDNKEKIVAELSGFCENIENGSGRRRSGKLLYHKILLVSPDFRMINGDSDAVSFHMFFRIGCPRCMVKFPSRSVALENIGYSVFR